MMNAFRKAWFALLTLLPAVVITIAPAVAQLPQKPTNQKPNIVVIMGDDVGMWNISAYHRGMMGGHTPNIDRIANEGALFTDRKSTRLNSSHLVISYAV